MGSVSSSSDSGLFFFESGLKAQTCGKLGKRNKLAIRPLIVLLSRQKLGFYGAKKKEKRKLDVSVPSYTSSNRVSGPA